MPVLPFHNYIGPGNDINNGPPVDDDDSIARRHDVKYGNARTPQDVRQADEEAIREFRRSWQNGNWHSLIGDVGLSLKYTVETYLGIVYPNLDTYQCEILPLFNNLLKLHCINKNKNKPVARYSLSLGDPKKVELFNKIRVHSDLSMGNFFFVLILWYQLCQKYQVPEMLTPDITQPIHHWAPHRTRVKGLLIKNGHLLEKFDVFHLKTWMRFFSVQRKEQVQADSYSEEEFTNLFFQYD